MSATLPCVPIMSRLHKPSGPWVLPAMTSPVCHPHTQRGHCAPRATPHKHPTHTSSPFACLPSPFHALRLQLLHKGTQKRNFLELKPEWPLSVLSRTDRNRDRESHQCPQSQTSVCEVIVSTVSL